ncbi:hypothetical protein H4582DRAFT_1929955 [Lactarius indigo]|nr:hypothetical protein H4582DRAFT_1929955 [Lactarius indigo]
MSPRSWTQGWTLKNADFWSAICSPVGPTTLSQKTAKATRMEGYLTKTPEKVAAIVRAAEMAGVDRTTGRGVCNRHRMQSEESTRIQGKEKSSAWRV